MKPFDTKAASLKTRPKSLLQRHWRWSRYSTADHIVILKKGIWVYFFLLIFEGALRKWFLPGLSTPLLVIRDPIALWLLLMSWRQGIYPLNPYTFMIQIIAIVCVYTAVFWGHGNLWVALFGARIFLIHFPLIFLIGEVFEREDVVKLGQVILAISIPMTVLNALQFYSPQTAWVNRGVGGDMAGAGFDGALGYFRPPGTFAFTNGNSNFYNLAGCFVFYFWLHQKEINKLLLVAATASLLASIPLSLSRTIFFQLSISFLFIIIPLLRKPQYIIRVSIGVLVCFLALSMLNQASFFQTSKAAFIERLTSAITQEGGVGSTLNSHFVGDLGDQIKEFFRQPFFGYGLGMGTNVGSMLLSNNSTFLISESEWNRITGELGPIMGITVILLRLLLGAKITFGCCRKLKEGEFLPWMLLSFGLMSLTMGGWAQPTSLGFSILLSGLMLAALKTSTTANQKTTLHQSV